MVYWVYRVFSRIEVKGCFFGVILELEIRRKVMSFRREIKGFRGRMTVGWD